MPRRTWRQQRTALEANERDNNGIGGPRKIDIRIVDTPQGRRLDVLREDLEDGRVVGHQRNVSLIANHQRYEFSLWAVDEKQWPQYDAAFKAMLDSVKFTPPDTGAFLVDKARNRWLDHHNHVAIDLPEGWAPVLNPVEGDQFWATGPAHGAVWPHNYLKVSRRPGKLDLVKLAKSRPDELQNHTEPPHEVLKCGLVKQGKTDALESIFSIFSVTVFERQFHVEGFNYEVSFTIESRRFNDLSPVIRECLDSFQVIPQPDPIGGTKPEDRRKGDIDLLGWGSWSTQGFRVRTLGRRPLRIGLRLSNYVRSLTFAPDGYTLASADEEGFIKIWDTRTGRVRSTFHNPPVDGLPHILQYVAFSPDGKTLAAGSSDRKLRIWDDGQPDDLVLVVVVADDHVDAVAVRALLGSTPATELVGRRADRAVALAGGPLDLEPALAPLAAADRVIVDRRVEAEVHAADLVLRL